MSGVAQPTGNFYQDTAKTLGSLFMSVKRANPNIKPGEAFRAVNALVQQMKGVAPEDRLLMQGSIAQMQIEYKTQADLLRAQSAEEVAQIRAKSAQDVAELRAENARLIAELNAGSRERVASTQAGARVQAAGIGAGARVQAAGIGAGAREYAADRGVDSAKERAGATSYSADRSADARRYGADRSVDAARARSGMAPQQAPATAASSTPPSSVLKEGVHTTFANGQVWTLQGGKPVRVK